MRTLAALFLLAVAAAAGDIVHLARGGFLRGEVVAETDDAITLDIGNGTIRLARDRIARIERDAAPAPDAATVREEWFLLLRGSEVVGWRSFVHVRDGGDRVEERCAGFLDAGGETPLLRRLERADPEGRPLEFLYAAGERMVSGQRRGARWSVQRRRGAELDVTTPDLGADWSLELTSWARLLDGGASREARILEPEAMRPYPARLVRTDRGCYLRPSGAGRGERVRVPDPAFDVPLPALGLVARPVSKDHVELVRRGRRPPPPLTLAQAQRFPFHEREEDLTVTHDLGGVAVTPPDDGWTVRRASAGTGRVLRLEKEGAFAEVVVHVLPRTDLAAALARVQGGAGAWTDPRDETIGGLPARSREGDTVRHDEPERVWLTAVQADRRTVVLEVRSHARWQALGARFAGEFRGSLRVAR